MIFLDHVNPLSIWSQRSSFMSSPELQLHGGFLLQSTTECSHRSHGAFTSSSATIVAPAFPVWWCVVRLSADPEFVCVFKDGSLSSCKNKFTSSCFRLKVLMSSVSRSRRRNQPFQRHNGCQLGSAWICFEFKCRRICLWRCLSFQKK